MSPQLNFNKEVGVFLVFFIYCNSLNSAWYIIGAKKYLVNEWMKNVKVLLKEG